MNMKSNMPKHEGRQDKASFNYRSGSERDTGSIPRVTRRDTALEDGQETLHWHSGDVCFSPGQLVVSHWAGH